MKINRHGRAKVLTQQEIQLIFTHGLNNDRDRTLFGVCLLSAARIREADKYQHLLWTVADVGGGDSVVDAVTRWGKCRKI